MLVDNLSSSRLLSYLAMNQEPGFADCPEDLKMKEAYLAQLAGGLWKWGGPAALPTYLQKLLKVKKMTSD